MDPYKAFHCVQTLLCVIRGRLIVCCLGPEVQLCLDGLAMMSYVLQLQRHFELLCEELQAVEPDSNSSSSSSNESVSMHVCVFVYMYLCMYV